jgi:uncharacterized protein (TIGR04255 family)
MAIVETFPNAPIVEAILSIEVDYLDDFHSRAGAFHEATRHLLPVEEEIESPTTTGQPLLGYRLTSEDGAQVVQLMRRSFSFHRLRPYRDWDQFSAAAQQMWLHYLRHFTPGAVRGINLRYLNRIEIPGPFGDVREYVPLSPNLPEGMDVGLAGYLLRLALVDPEVPAVAYVTQRTEQRSSIGNLPLLFDIDVRSEAEMPAGDDALWRVIGRLRDYKNRLFFSSITEAARELFR